MGLYFDSPRLSLCALNLRKPHAEELAVQLAVEKHPTTGLKKGFKNAKTQLVLFLKKKSTVIKFKEACS